MKKVLIIIVSLIGAFFLGMLTYATTMWSKARKKLTPEEYELFDELIEKTF